MGIKRVDLNRELVASSSPEGVDIALLENRELVELHREKMNKQFTVGDVYLAKVNKLVSGLNAAFVDVGYEKDAFLHYTDLGPNIPTLERVVKRAIAGNLDDPLLSNIKFESPIVKTGKINDVLKKKQSILVQVLKEPISTKGPRLTSEITLPGRYIILMPFGNSVGISKRVTSADERKRLMRLIESIKPKNFGVVVRTVAEGKSVADLHEDMSNLLDRWKQIITNLKGATPPTKIHGELNKTNTILRDLLNDSFNKISTNDMDLAGEIETYLKKIAPDKKKMINRYSNGKPIFDAFGITKQIKTLFGKTVTIPGGAYLVIEHTEALHVIDVNSGHKIATKSDQETTALQVNLGAAKEVARQLRLRDIGGIIVIDFIDMKKVEHKRELVAQMRGFMETDRAKHSILQLSKFGLMQITRERTRPEVNITTVETCPSCNGTGKIEASILLVDEIEQKLEYLIEKKQSFKLITHPYVEAFIKKGIPSLRMKWSFKYKKPIPIFCEENYTLTQYAFVDSEGEQIDV